MKKIIFAFAIIFIPFSSISAFDYPFYSLETGENGTSTTLYFDNDFVSGTISAGSGSSTVANILNVPFIRGISGVAPLYGTFGGVTISGRDSDANGMGTDGGDIVLFAPHSLNPDANGKGGSIRFYLGAATDPEVTSNFGQFTINYIVAGLDEFTSTFNLYGVPRTTTWNFPNTGDEFPTLLMATSSQEFKLGIGTTSSLVISGDLSTEGDEPIVSACGTGPNVAKGSTDTSGRIKQGSSSTGCTLTFATAKGKAPFCTISSMDGLRFSYDVTKTTITITNIDDISSKRLVYTCIGNQK